MLEFCLRGKNCFDVYVEEVKVDKPEIGSHKILKMYAHVINKQVIFDG